LVHLVRHFASFLAGNDVHWCMWCTILEASKAEIDPDWCMWCAILETSKPKTPLIGARDAPFCEFRTRKRRSLVHAVHRFG
jgi:hypothetical protein